MGKEPLSRGELSVVGAQGSSRSPQPADSSAKPTGLALLREPFPPHQISKLPKPTKTQTDAVKADFKKGVRCKECGSWHHPDSIHLDYVGHAALTDRLLDADLEWTWEPVGDPKSLGLPTSNDGMWIRLTVCGVTRLGFGSADGKNGGDAVKEVIGDALRNAAMRFGAALDLWHKGQLHEDDEPAALPAKPPVEPAKEPEGYSNWLLDLEAAADNGPDALRKTWKDSQPYMKKFMQDHDAAKVDALRTRSEKAMVPA